MATDNNKGSKKIVTVFEHFRESTTTNDSAQRVKIIEGSREYGNTVTNRQSAPPAPPKPKGA